MNIRIQEKLIRLAQREADKAIAKGNPPFGAVLTDRFGTVVAKAYNTQNSSLDTTAHAEISLLRKACRKLKTRYLYGCHLFTNAESCSMCASAVIKARIKHIYFAAPHESKYLLYVSVFELAKRAKWKLYVHSGILEKECAGQIRRGRKREKFLHKRKGRF